MKTIATTMAVILVLGVSSVSAGLLGEGTLARLVPERDASGNQAGSSSSAARRSDPAAQTGGSEQAGATGQSGATEQSGESKKPPAGSASPKKPKPATKPPQSAPAGTPGQQKPAAQAPGAKPAAQKPQAAEKPYVYTNLDLMRFIQPGDRAKTQDAVEARDKQAEFEQQSLEKYKDWKEHAAETEKFRAKMKKDAEDRLAEARARYDQLKALDLSQKAGYLPVPQLTEAQNKDRQTLSMAEQRAKIEADIKAAEQDVAAAEANLAEVNRRLASAPPK